MACDAGPANVCRTCEILLQVFDNVPAEGVRGGSVVKAAERSARWIKLGCTLEQSDRWVRTCLFAGSCRPLLRGAATKKWRLSNIHREMPLTPEEVLFDDSSNNSQEEEFWQQYPSDYRYFINAFLCEEF